MASWKPLVVAGAAGALLFFAFPQRAPSAASANTGALTALDSTGKPAGACPLKHTAVQAEISGFLARATVTQEFHNPFQQKIEAVYTFPLPQNAAVDDMTMHVGTRVVKGKIKPREEARAIYEAARASGRVASLLDQERPNIFTQSVANIMPGEKVTIVISYVETLKFEDGSYEFVFPMVVGPRYIPGAPTGKQGGGWSPDTNRVPDASRITPPVAVPGTRAGHDISLEVKLDAGVPIDSVACATHEVLVRRPSASAAVVRLKDQATLPNKDFILRYDVAGRKIQDAVLVHRAERGGFFTLILQPPERVAAEEVTPKELVFVLDTSGSMSGFPIEKAKETMQLRSERPLSARHVQPDHLRRRHAHPVSEAGTGDRGEPGPGARIPGLAAWEWRHGDDEGDPRGAGGVGRAGPRPRGLLHDRRLRGQRHGDRRRGA